ncbi:hypothetical protein [Micromonospora chersina]|uniref:hypothetical protein n=1 Tax=Micromonospora chersina TaxID=47854 RepID=UPI0033B9CD36
MATFGSGTLRNEIPVPGRTGLPERRRARMLLTLVYYGLRDGHIRALAPAKAV